MMLMTVQPAAWQRSFSQLRNRMSGGAETASAVEHRRLVEEMPIHQFCEARELTLTKIAGERHNGQGDASALERRTDYACQPPASCRCRRWE